MKTAHLDSPTLGALLSGRLSEEQEQALFAHLGVEDCPDCEATLAEMDARTEGQLFALLARAREARPLPSLLPQILERSRPAPWVLRPWLMVPALATALVLGWFLLVGRPLLFPSDPEGRGIKGSGELTASAITLSVGLIQIDGQGQKSVIRLGSGVAVEESRQLVLGLTTTRACYLALFRICDQEVQRILPTASDRPLFHPGGLFTPSEGGKPLAYSLRGSLGAQTFVGLCAQRPIALEEEARRLQALLRGGQPLPASTRELSYDQVRIRVLAGGPSP